MLLYSRLPEAEIILRGTIGELWENVIIIKQRVTSTMHLLYILYLLHYFENERKKIMNAAKEIDAVTDNATFN